jgi:ribosomal protein S18 acetylase RimI-like enzyme
VTRAPARRLVQLSAEQLTGRLADALQIYVTAMGYPPSTARQRRTLWLEHLRRPGWRAVTWLDSADAMLGIAYGYPGSPGQWWYDEVRRGLRDAGPHGQRWLVDYFELTELHIRPDAQGHGLGEGLLRELLTGTDKARVMLSTPEYGDQAPGRAWQLYRRLGFVDVLRDHRFTGDFRPFAVLGRELPLDSPTPPTR